VALTLSQLITPMTAAQIRSQGVVFLQSLGLQPTLWAQGGAASTFLTYASNVLANVSTSVSSAIAQQWNPTASGGGLQMLSQYGYGITPPQATFATGNVVLSNIGGFTGTFTAGQATFQNSVANPQGVYAQYQNTGTFTVNPGTPSSPSVVIVPVSCTTIGTAGNGNPGFVSLLITTMPGVSCTNPAAILGSDSLSDASLRALNMASLSVRGTAYGPRGAYAYAIQQATNVVSGLPVNVNRWSISPSSHTGTVTIYVASPSGPVITSDMQGISLSIDALARPDCVTVLPGLSGYPSAPASATVVDYAPAITVYVSAIQSPAGAITPVTTGPLTAANLETVIDNYLDAWFGSPNNPIGGVQSSDDIFTNVSGVFESGIDAIIGAAVASVSTASAQCFVTSTRFATPGDLTLTAGEVAAWAGTVTVVINYLT
jgi:hypothetical protein